MKWLPGAVGVLLITVGAVGCSSQPSAFADRVNAAQQATIPPGGELLQPPVLSSDSTKSTAHWTVSTQMDWTSYVSWLGQG